MDWKDVIHFDQQVLLIYLYFPPSMVVFKVYYRHSFFYCFHFMSFLKDMFREFGFAFCVCEVFLMFFEFYIEYQELISRPWLQWVVVPQNYEHCYCFITQANIRRKLTEQKQLLGKKLALEYKITSGKNYRFLVNATILGINLRNKIRMQKI